MNAQNRRLDGALVLGALALLLLPWYSLEAGFFDFGWLSTLWQDQASAPALWQILVFQRPWLTIALLMLVVCALARLLHVSRLRSQLLMCASAVGVVFFYLKAMPSATAVGIGNGASICLARSATVNRRLARALFC